MICIQKIYGFHGINRQNIEKSWYVTPVTNGRTEDGGGKWKIEQCSVGPETAIMWYIYRITYQSLTQVSWSGTRNISGQMCQSQLFQIGGRSLTENWTQKPDNYEYWYKVTLLWARHLIFGIFLVWRLVFSKSFSTFKSLLKELISTLWLVRL